MTLMCVCMNVCNGQRLLATIAFASARGGPWSFREAMGGGHGKFKYDTIGGTTLSYDGHDPAYAHASPLISKRCIFLGDS